MSDSLVTCPFCGLDVPEGRYCKICGKPLDLGDSISRSQEESQPETKIDFIVPPVEAEKVIQPHFDVSIEDMEKDAAVVLLSRSELDIVDIELDSIIDRIKATRQALQLQKANKQVLTARAEDLRAEFEKTKNRRRELASVSGSIALESLLDALDKDETRLTRLEEISGTLDKAVYKEQRTDILSSIKEIRENLKTAIKNAKKWVKGIKKTLRSLEKEMNRIEAKFKIGDLSRDSYDSTKVKLERNIKIVEGSQERLISLLRTAEKR